MHLINMTLNFNNYEGTDIIGSDELDLDKFEEVVQTISAYSNCKSTD